ncbi:MAG: hypothetical protein HYX56_02930 [Chloroflexi bacterium]|nr:hypothetical protein [Chloroflexota bacterium]
MSPRTRKVIELAIDEADRMKQQTVSAGHLLIGLVREGEGIASGIIQSLKVDLEAVRQKVIEEMRKGS